LDIFFQSDFFYPARQYPAWQQDASPTIQAFKPNISTQAIYFPIMTAAWMWFSQVNNVIYM